MENHNETHVHVLIKTVFGQEKYYPHNENARIFCKMLGSKTLTMKNLTYIKALGFTIKASHDNKLGDLL